MVVRPRPFDRWSGGWGRRAHVDGPRLRWLHKRDHPVAITPFLKEDTMKRPRTGMLALLAALPLAFGAVACDASELQQQNEDGGVEDGVTDDGL